MSPRRLSMRPVLPLLALALAACVPPGGDAPADLLPDSTEAVAPAAFDAPGWLRDAAALDTLADLDERDARSRELAARLDAVTAWTQACDMDDPAGQLYLHPLGDGRYLVEAVCFLAAYQANVVLVGVEGEAARVLRVPLYDETGALAKEATALGGYVATDDAGPGTFDVVSLARGAGGCGTRTRYRLAGDRAEPLLVRARSCDADCPESDCTDPASWPVVHPAP